MISIVYRSLVLLTTLLTAPLLAQDVTDPQVFFAINPDFPEHKQLEISVISNDGREMFCTLSMKAHLKHGADIDRSLLLKNIAIWVYPGDRESPSVKAGSLELSKLAIPGYEYKTAEVLTRSCLEVTEANRKALLEKFQGWKRYMTYISPRDSSTLHFWDEGSGVDYTLKSDNPIQDYFFSDDKSRLLIVGPHDVSVYSYPDLKKIVETNFGREKFLLTARISADGRYVVISSTGHNEMLADNADFKSLDGTLEVLDIESNRVIASRNFKGKLDSDKLAISPNAPLIAAVTKAEIGLGDYDDAIVLRLPELAYVKTLNTSLSFPKIKFSRDGRWLGVANAKGVLHVYDSSTHELTDGRYLQSQFFFDFSPNGEQVIIASDLDDNASVWMWRRFPKTFEPVFPALPQRSVLAAQFSENGESFLVTLRKKEAAGASSLENRHFQKDGREIPLPDALKSAGSLKFSPVIPAPTDKVL